MMWQEIWNKRLFEITDGQTISVSQIILAGALLLSGIVLSLLISRLIEYRLKKTRIDRGLAHTVQKVLFYTMLVIVALTVLHMLNIPITMFAVAGGALAIGVGFGAQNIINNFISGWILPAERPVRVGDLVEVGSNLGRIESIGTRCTHIRRTDGIDMMVPNSVILERTVVNWTLIDHDIRTSVRIGVQYGSPTDQVAKLLRQAADKHDQILDSPDPIVIFEDFGDNALVFDVFFWCHVESEMALRLIRSDLRFHIDKQFSDAGIVIAFPQQDTHLDTPVPLDVRLISTSNTVTGSIDQHD